jgi:hypothetical protein
MTVSRKADGPVSLRIMLGGNRDGAPLGDVIEVVVESDFAVSVIRTLAGNSESADVGAPERRGAACVPCHVGISRRPNHGFRTTPS